MSLQMRCWTQKKRFWRLKNHSKSSSEGLKIHPKRSSKAIVLQRTPSNIIFFEYLQFSDDFWTPKCTSNSRKNPSNSMLQNNTFLDSNLKRIFYVLASENERQIEQLAYLFENTYFVKIIVFFRENHYFSGSEPRKIDQNWMLKRNET